jgi:hypothetical protein
MWVGEGGRGRVSVELPNFRTEGNSRPDPWEYIPNYPEFSSGSLMVTHTWHISPLPTY